MTSLSTADRAHREIRSKNSQLQAETGVAAQHKATGQRLTDLALGCGRAVSSFEVGAALHHLRMGEPGRAEVLIAQIGAGSRQAARGSTATRTDSTASLAPELTGDARRLAILDLPEAIGRGPMSEHLAIETTVSVCEARALLTRAPVDEDEEAAVEAKMTTIALRGDDAAPRADGWLARRIALRTEADHQYAARADEAASQAAKAHAGTEEAEAVAILAAYRR